MKRQPAEYARTFFLMWAILATQTGCALIFGGAEEAPTKSTAVHFSPPPSPYTHIAVSSADEVWQSTRTGNTIAFNSGCDGDGKSRRAQEFLSEVKELKVQNESHVRVDGVDGERVKAAGKTEGVPIQVEVVTYRKNKCTYDLTYVARKTSFDEELSLFENFVGAFHAD